MFPLNFDNFVKDFKKFDEDLKAKCIEDFKGLQGIIITDNPELLCVYGDIYVVCFASSDGLFNDSYSFCPV